MVRKSVKLKRVTDSGTFPVEPPSLADIETDPLVDGVLDIVAPPRSEGEWPKLSEAASKIGAASIVEVPQDHTGGPLYPVFAPYSQMLSTTPSPVRVVRMQTIRLGQAATDLSVSWGSRFDPALCSIYLHRVSATSNPTGHLSAPVFENSNPVQLQLRIVRDNFPTPLPEGSIYLGSYSDIHVGPAMHSLHVFLLP